MKNFKLIGVFAALILSVQANAAPAESRTFPEARNADSNEFQTHIGIVGGVVNTNNSSGNDTDYGLDIGYQPFVPYGLGLEATYSQSDDTNGTNEDRTSLLAKGTYNFGGETPVIKNSYAGVALGSILRPDNSYFAGGPILGFDIPVERKWTLGANAKYLFIDGTEPDATVVNAAVKYWF
jgi:hypothetical protein